ncbi:helix-turn-helix domain-containing protein [Acidithiobacillus thiooxidans]|uniref:helix-turn-helix domain-containing protein n=1 Tax=Acidithiobacillus thiooxidans TaxID=930 RepID=UPI001C079489|nr:helix-turn-helix transcriptional regulator [Acidithiobacillus thiooxidans]MBU2843797.1 helix-turn-helix transcriptional regulator [Acidithiobacillus thiooxidans]
MSIQTNKTSELIAFSQRLNASLDALGFPPKGKGRQEALGKEMGVSQKGARKWLEGESFPSEQRKRRLADFCRVRYEWLYTGVGLPSDHVMFDVNYPAIKLDWEHLLHDVVDSQERMDRTASTKPTSVESFLASLPSDVNPTARALVEQILVNAKCKKLPESALLVLLSLVSQLSKE